MSFFNRCSCCVTFLCLDTKPKPLANDFMKSCFAPKDSCLTFLAAELCLLLRSACSLAVSFSISCLSRIHALANCLLLIFFAFRSFSTCSKGLLAREALYDRLFDTALLSITSLCSAVWCCFKARFVFKTAFSSAATSSSSSELVAFVQFASVPLVQFEAFPALRRAIACSKSLLVSSDDMSSSKLSSSFADSSSLALRSSMALKPSFTCSISLVMSETSCFFFASFSSSACIAGTRSFTCRCTSLSTFSRSFSCRSDSSSCSDSLYKESRLSSSMLSPIRSGEM
mmetsp:Transcript_12700/g.29265  ORF Transcript_12700/g.29265 Transcript_12700/m.29265 type:complete len:285 (-) Transcript_12700:205-1059(-)